MHVAVPVGPQNFGVDAVGLDDRHRHHPGDQPGYIDLLTEFDQVYAVGQVGGGWGEHVPSGKGRPGCRKLVGGLGERHGPAGPPDQGHRRSEESVVGADQYRVTVADLDGYRPPVGGHPGIDDGENHPTTEVLGASGQSEGARPDVEGRYAVGDVDDGRMRGDGADHRMDDSDKFVLGAVVREERDSLVATTHFHPPPSWRDRSVAAATTSRTS